MLDKQFIKRFLKYTPIFALLVFLFYFVQISNPKTDLDNFWNFHFIQNIVNGFVPYRDFNIIIPPLFHFLGAIFFIIFGTSFSSFYLYGAIIGTINIFLLIAVTKKLSSNKYFLYLIATSSIALYLIVFLPNYNMLINTFVLLILYLELSKSKSDKYFFYKIGLCFSLLVLSKHTIGFVFAFFYLIYFLYKTKYDNSNYKKRDLLKIILSGLIPITAFIIYLLMNNAFVDFINYAFGGIIDFGTNNVSTALLSFPISLAILSIILLIFASYFGQKSHKNVLLSLFSVACIFIDYPLANEYHTIISSFIQIIPFFYGMLLCIKTLKSEQPKQFYKVICILFCILSTSCLLFIGFNLCTSFDFDIINRRLDNGFSIYNSLNGIKESDIISIKNIHDYYVKKQKEGYNVLILSSRASFIEIPYGINQGVYDLLLNGNMGYDGENRIIKNLEKIDNPLFIKTKTKFLFWQESKKIDEYIKNNYKLIEEIEGMNVWVKSEEKNDG